MAQQPVSSIRSPSRPQSMSTSTDDVIGAAVANESAAIANPRGGSHPHILSCTNCRKRKVKCTKTSPCAACDRSNITCIFPNRARLPRGRSIPGGPKTTNVELLRRVSKLEELLEKATYVGSDIKDAKNVGRKGSAKTAPREAPNDVGSRVAEASPGAIPVLSGLSPNSSEDILDKYIGSTFWKNLTHEVG